MATTNMYVVTAYRYGDRESHSYVVGVFKKKAKAQEAALAERETRGGMYRCEVLECSVDSALRREFKVVFELERDPLFGSLGLCD